MKHCIYCLARQPYDVCDKCSSLEIGYDWEKSRTEYSEIQEWQDRQRGIKGIVRRLLAKLFKL